MFKINSVIATLVAVCALQNVAMAELVKLNKYNLVYDTLKQDLWQDYQGNYYEVKSNRTTYQEAKKYCEDLSVGVVGKGWMLPDVETAVEVLRWDTYFWTSTEIGNNGIYTVGAGNKYDWDDKSNNYYQASTRCIYGKKVKLYNTPEEFLKEKSKLKNNEIIIIKDGLQYLINTARAHFVHFNKILNANIAAPEAINAKPSKIVWEKLSPEYYWSFNYDVSSSLLWAIPSPKIAEGFYLEKNGNFQDYKEFDRIKRRLYYSMDQRYDIYKENVHVGNLKTLNISGYSNWRLPVEAEFKSALPFVSASFRNIYCYGWNGHDGVGFPMAFRQYDLSYFRYVNKVYPEPEYSKEIFEAHKLSISQLKEFQMIPILVKRLNKDEGGVFDTSVSVDEKVKKLLAYKLTQKLNPPKPKISQKPTKPNQIQPQTLEKGEFEKTPEYNKRVEDENIRVQNYNTQLGKDYQADFAKWQDEVSRVNTEYKTLLDSLRKPDSLKLLTNEAANEAIATVLGDPVFRSYKYNADKEVFVVEVESTLNGYTQTVEVPVPIAKAPEFKSRMADSKIIPQVVFSFENDKLQVVSADAITNSMKQTQDYEIAEGKDTIAAYKSFIASNPNAPQVSKAQAKIEAIEQKIREQEIAEQKARVQRQKEEEARQEQERKAYMVKKSIGDKVCKDGRVAMGLIGVTISAYVEGVNGESIQLRINDTEGQDINYNGGNLHSGKVIWDKYYEWKKCQ